jgi:DNA-binding PadR family transcriptional regulator
MSSMPFGYPMRRLTRDPEALLPLKQATYQILLALGDGESRHGYAVMQAIAEITGGRETILPGTLYAALARMVDEGLVEESEPRADEVSGGPPRRYYKRTSFGRAVARAESERLRALLEVARAQKILGGGK